MGNLVSDLCFQTRSNKNHRNQCSCCHSLQKCLTCYRAPRSPSAGLQDNFSDVHCAYNDDYTIDTVCIQGQAMILPPNESTIEPFITDLGGSMNSAEYREHHRGSLGGNVIYKQPQQPLSVGLLQVDQSQTRLEQYDSR